MRCVISDKSLIRVTTSFFIHLTFNADVKKNKKTKPKPDSFFFRGHFLWQLDSPCDWGVRNSFAVSEQSLCLISNHSSTVESISKKKALILPTWCRKIRPSVCTLLTNNRCFSLAFKSFHAIKKVLNPLWAHHFLITQLKTPDSRFVCPQTLELCLCLWKERLERINSWLMESKLWR